MDGPPFEAWEMELHGHRVMYRMAGSGPPVVLIHGMVNSSRHWEGVAQSLASDYTVIAPDLIGHGDSATPPPREWPTIVALSTPITASRSRMLAAWAPSE